ncbi:hypothetical protein DU15_0838 [Chlamydia trachomatis]|nr:hypothetical protein DU15_0838 [Chlamydia trachomatis]ROT55821.1 hypothetical protein DU10_0839 [Chlamydia trachomatis]CPR43394.1 Uncharacterised protein [Chlamydia trachomatis]CPR54491.1 Uncharacterised protein [Chlamydia trachomatis]CQB85341.1 Uncharacterised protein [Chlamydia trachomatis]
MQLAFSKIERENWVVFSFLEIREWEHVFLLLKKRITRVLRRYVMLSLIYKHMPLRLQAQIPFLRLLYLRNRVKLG